MSLETALQRSFGIWVAGILALLWLCIETTEAEISPIASDELAETLVQEASRCAS